MTDSRLSLADAAQRLQAAVLQETALARSGAVAELDVAGAAKRAAFAAFSAACQAHRPDAARTDADRAALRALLDATDENANVLDAVRATLEGLAGRLRAALAAALDPGVYSPNGRRSGHLLAARYDASA